MSHALLDLLAKRELPGSFASSGKELPAPTISADLRHSGYKLVPVDVNMFPAGWNNLCPAALPSAGKQLLAWSKARGFSGKNVIVFVEWMTRNPSYIENLLAIGKALSAAGIQYRYAALSPELPPAGQVISGLAGGQVLIEPLVEQHGQIATASGFVADWVLSNNDFSSGVPDRMLQASTPVAPHPGLGWHARKKRHFFMAYQHIARRAAEAVGLDPWCLIPDTVVVENVDFWNQVGLEAVAEAVDAMLDRITAQYKARGIYDAPFVVVKDEAGTFGMGVLTLDSSTPIREANRKLRQKMATGKGGRQINSVLVQEGVYTRDVVGNCTAEPVVMAIGGHMVGGFYRYHCSRSETENLNAKGAVFAKMCGLGSQGGCGQECIRDEARYKVYGWLAELAAAASGIEAAAVR